mgnify:CR=1 FL=1
MTAARTILNDKLRYFLLDFTEECLRCQYVFSQALTQTIRVITAHTDGIVVIHLDITESAILQQFDYLLAQVIDYPWI